MVERVDYFQQYVRLEPPAILNFDPSTAKQVQDFPNTQEIITFLKIHNSAPLTDGKNLAYKIKTTAPKFYQVKPFQGIVAPNSTNSIEITYIPMPGTNVTKMGDFWNAQPKESVKSYKLVVTTNKAGSPDDVVPELTNSELRLSGVSDLQQSEKLVVNLSENLQQNDRIRQETVYKSTEQQISQESANIGSRPSITSQYAVNDEVRRLIQQIADAEKTKKDLKSKLDALQQKQSVGVSNSQSSSGWLTPIDNGKKAKGYQLFHLMAISLVFLFLGKYLAAGSSGVQPIVSV